VSAHDYDERLRAAMFAYLDGLRSRHGDRLTTAQLNAFEFEGKSIALLQHMRGIRTISGLECALSIRTTYSATPDARPYEDGEGPDGYLRYKWRGTDPLAYDNVALRRASNLARPLVYFMAIAPGQFIALYPVWLVGEEPQAHQFIVAIDDVMREQWLEAVQPHPADLALRREYAEQTIRTRLHQRAFRARVLLAYESQCALCRLRHSELLDAAHLKEDADGGQPVVPNGVAMCAIHHRAFDAQVLGIRPDYVVERPDVLIEHDGPTLQHALQELHLGGLHLPKQRAALPDRELLAERYDRFRLAS
jgi:putative restriction endonuclease